MGGHMSVPSLLEGAYELSNQYTSETFSNIGGYQSPSSAITEEGPLQELLQVQLACLQKVLRDVDQVDYSRLNSWINISKGGDFNMTHLHPSSNWSCCAYLNMPGGSIVFEDPRAGAEMQERMYDTEGSYEIFPEVGDILFFPSWLKHSVLPSYSKEDRVSVASNYTIHRRYNE